MELQAIFRHLHNMPSEATLPGLPVRPDSRSMRQTLSLQVQTFFTNKDSFTNDCPADLDPEKDLGCACWMAKNRYGGFMGPFAMLEKDEE